MSNHSNQELADIAPDSDTLTVYDRAQLRLYARLLDAEADGAALQEVAKHLFGIDAENEPERARRVHDSHLVRAHWIAQRGYRELLLQS